MDYIIIMQNAVFHSLSGGLGNQLFEIFTTISYALKYNKDFMFPYESKLPNCFIKYYRNTYWHNLFESIIHHTTYMNSSYTNDFIKDTPNRYNEINFTYDEIPNNENENLLLSGHFQSYKYFEENYDKIYNLLNLDNKINEIKNKYNSYFQDNKHIISMHFRLGDYKLKPSQHPILSQKYYEKSIQHILHSRNIDNPVIFVFCEEEDNYIIENIITDFMSLFPNIEFKKIHHEIEDWKQMLLMSCCNDNIIANSTFSWWGAYLNNHCDKIVTYPSLWFGIGNNTTLNDLIPSNWIMIKN